MIVYVLVCVCACVRQKVPELASTADTHESLDAAAAAAANVCYPSIPPSHVMRLCLKR